MKRLTKAQASRLHDLQMMVFARRDRIYRAVPREDVPFSECLKAAPREDVAALDKAREDLTTFEHDMIKQGRGYWDAFGFFRGY